MKYVSSYEYSVMDILSTIQLGAVSTFLNTYEAFLTMVLDELMESASLEILDLVFEKRSAGNKIISLYIGEPVFDTPSEIIEAAVKSINSGMTHYISSYGLPELRDAIVSKVRKKNRIMCTSENTIFMSGKMAIYSSALALNSSKGSEVLVPDPGYFYTEPSIMAGLKPVTYNLNPDYSLNLEEIKKKITERTKGIFINTPSNPTGYVYSENELKALYLLCSEKGIKIISDEAYEDLVYEKKHFSIGSLEEEPQTVISIFTLSKSYSMTGWRGGYIVAEKSFIKRLGKFMEHAVTCFPPFVEQAAIVALERCDKQVSEFRRMFLERRNLSIKLLKEIDKLKVNDVQGAFYIFPEYKMKIPAKRLSEDILKNKNVALLPGSAFGSKGEGHLRLSFSGSLEDIREGMERLSDFFNNI